MQNFVQFECTMAFNGLSFIAQAVKVWWNMCEIEFVWEEKALK